MPVRGQLRSIGAPYAQDKRRSFGIGIAGNRRQITPLHNRGPFQITEVHNLVRVRARFLILAVNRRRKHGRTNQRDTHASHSNLFHSTLLCQKIGALNWPKDTPPARRRQHRSISRSRSGHRARRDALDSLETRRKSRTPQSRYPVSLLRMEFLPILPRPGATGIPGPPRQRYPPRHRLSVASRYGASPHSTCAQEEPMKIALSFLLAAALVCAAAPSSYAEPRQVMQGTQVHLTLVSGIIGTVEKARHFSMFRGQAYMNLTFRSIEVDSRLIPVQMSIITIEQPHGQVDGKRRKDVKIEEGQVVQEKHDVKGDIVGATIGTGGGTLIGAVFSHVVRGFGFGLAGSAAYIVARKGKDLDLPAQTGMLIRMDNTITVPVTSASNASLTTGSR